MNGIEKIKNFLVGGDERTSKMKRNTLSMLLIKGISIIISLAYIPMMLKYVDRADYGVLLTLTSIVHWVAMLDIGLGNGLRNSITEDLALQNYDKAKESVSSCYAALTLYVTIIIVIFIFVAPFLSWKSILNAQSNSETELLSLVIIVFISFCVQFVLSLLTSVIYACQIPAFTSYILLATQVLNYVLVYIMIHFLGITTILGIGTATCLVPPIVIVVFSFFLYRKKLAHIAPSIRFIRLKSVNGILSLGMKFFVIQVISIVLFQANNIIITQAVGPEAVVVYNVVYKYIGLIVVIFNIIITPVWSAATDAYVREDYEWMKKTVKYIRKVFWCVLLCGIIMFLLSPVVYRIWLGKDTIDIPYVITGLVLAYCLFEILYKIYGTIINGTGKLHLQMIVTSIIAILYIPFAFFLGRTMGLNGVLIANTIVFFLNYIWSKRQCNKIINQTATGIWNK